MNNFLLLLACCFCYGCKHSTAIKNANEIELSNVIATSREKSLRDSVKFYSTFNSVDLINSVSPFFDYDKNIFFVKPVIEVNNLDNDTLFFKEVTIKTKSFTIKILEDVNLNSYVFNQNNQFFRIRYLSELLTKESDLTIDYRMAEYYLFANSTKIAIVATPERWSGLADSFVLCQIVDLKNKEFIQVVKKRHN